MKKTNNKVEKEILSFVKKLPPIKKMEALDFIRWLWVSEKPPESYKIRYEKMLRKIWQKVEKGPVTEEEIDKIVEEVRAERYAESGR
jgi:hypothetical protein